MASRIRGGLDFEASEHEPRCEGAHAPSRVAAGALTSGFRLRTPVGKTPRSLLPRGFSATVRSPAPEGGSALHPASEAGLNGGDFIRGNAWEGGQFGGGRSRPHVTGVQPMEGGCRLFVCRVVGLGGRGLVGWHFRAGRPRPCA